MSKRRSQLWARRYWKSQEQTNAAGLKIALDKASCIDTTTCIHRASPITPPPTTSIITDWRELSPSSTTRFSDSLSDFRAASFLRSCYMCDKKLDGEDIYMYRGEKAFCSMECRSWQILADEYHENRHGSMSFRPLEASDSVGRPDIRV